VKGLKIFQNVKTLWLSVLSLAKKVLVTYKPLDMQMWANQNAFDVANVTSLLDVWIFLGFVSCPCLSCSMGLST
jgi:hypothetical protein